MWGKGRTAKPVRGSPRPRVPHSLPLVVHWVSRPWGPNALYSRSSGESLPRGEMLNASIWTRRPTFPTQPLSREAAVALARDVQRDPEFGVAGVRWGLCWWRRRGGVGVGCRLQWDQDAVGVGAPAGWGGLVDGAQFDVVGECRRRTRFGVGGDQQVSSAGRGAQHDDAAVLAQPRSGVIPGGHDFHRIEAVGRRRGDLDRRQGNPLEHVRVGRLSGRPTGHAGRAPPGSVAPRFAEQGRRRRRLPARALLGRGGRRRCGWGRFSGGVEAANVLTGRLCFGHDLCQFSRLIIR